MEYTRLGSTGMKVSRICLGCMGFGDAERWVHKWVLNEEDSRPIIRKALDLGINFFDTANVYSSVERLREPGRGRHRHQALQPDARGTEWRRAVAQGDLERDRQEPQAARDGL